MFDIGVSTETVTDGDDAGSVGIDSCGQKFGGVDYLHSIADAAVGDACVAGLSSFAAMCRIGENLERAKCVESVCEITEIRLATADVRGADALTEIRDIVCEVAAALGVSQMVARPLVETGMTLERLPLTGVRFVCGVLDWARVLVLASVLGKASDATIALMEFETVAAAERLSPRALRCALWRLWFATDRQEAAAAQKVAVKGARGVSVRQDSSGVSIVQAALTDLEGAEAEALIEEIVSTVCGRDPRSAKQLRADGLMALLHSEHSLECLCGEGESCPQFGVADLPDRRRGYLVQILIDVETLLGLSQEPATLADGTPVDSEVARALAADAQWQGLLMELRDGLAASGSQPSRTTTGGKPATDAAAESATSATAATDAAATAAAAAAAAPTATAADAAGSRFRLPRLLFRGRVRRGGTVPAPTAAPGRSGPPRNDSSHDTSCSTSEAMRVRTIAALLSAIDADPALAAGCFADGHGGHIEPPAGALTYRPSADVAARTRMTYRTCTHPGCEVPSPRCELDHIVPFRHAEPRGGGWTIESNLHPVCKGHHQLKTAKLWHASMLNGGAILWTSGAGLRSITLPELGCPSAPRSRKRARPSPATDFTAPTWWEKNMPDDAPEPTAAEHRHAVTDAARTRMRLLRRRFRQHKFIRNLRERNEPPPF